MRDDAFRSVTGTVAGATSRPEVWPFELATALLCFAILHPEHNVSERNVSSAEIHATILTWTNDHLKQHAGRPIPPYTQLLVDTHAAYSRKDTAYASNILRRYLEPRKIPLDTTPNLHSSHLDVLGEYLTGVYSITDGTLIRYRFFPGQDPVFPVGQVNVYITDDVLRMQGIIVCPFFSAYQKTLPDKDKKRVADMLVQHATQDGKIRPTVIPIWSNASWQERLREKTFVDLVEDDDLMSVVSDWFEEETTPKTARKRPLET